MKCFYLLLLSTAMLLGGLVGASHAQPIHLWDFNSGSELSATFGGLDLEPAVGPGTVDVNGDGSLLVGGEVGDIVYETGWDSQAYRPYYVDPTVASNAGAGLVGDGFTTPAGGQFTIEAVVKPDASSTVGPLSYIFQTRPAGDRGYYLAQDVPEGRTAAGSLGSVIGNSFSDRGTVDYANAGDWYYLAAAIDLTSNAGQATADIYLANLTAGDDSATLVLDDRTWGYDGTLAGNTGIFGIGNFARRVSALEADDQDPSTPDVLVPAESQEWFEGAIDYIAIYDGLVDVGGVASLREHIAGRTVPEPASLALLCLGGMCLAARRR